MTTEVEKKAEQLVEEVEEPLRERKEKAIKEARKADKEDTENTDSSIQFWSPRIVGGEKVDSYRGEQIKFHLSEELPNGKAYFKVNMPDEDSVTDESHELNRLLSLYNVDVDRVADLNNKKLPLLPTGDYNDPENVNYHLDQPPIPTIPNKIVYRIRRFAMRSRLIKYRRTPSIHTDMFGDIEEISYQEMGSTPSMSPSAYPYFRLFGLDESTDQFVPSEFGVGVMFLSQWLIPTLALFATFGLGVFTGLLSIFFLLIATLINITFVANNINRVGKYIKNRFFPDP